MKVCRCLKINLLDTQFFIEIINLQTMKKTISSIKFSFLLVVLFSFSSIFGQAPQTIEFRGETIEMPENILEFEWNQMPESSILDKGYIGWVQFYETPTQEVQDMFQSKNLQLIGYIPHQTYLFYFPENTSVSLLQENGVRSIIPVPEATKLAENLKTGDFESWAWSGDQLKIYLEYYPEANVSVILNDLKTLSAHTSQAHERQRIVELSIHPDNLEELAQRAYLKWAELIEAPSVKDDDNGRGLHRANGLDSRLSTGRRYNGEGIGVMVRDDGFVGPHIDFEGRITNHSTRRNESHGDGVAGIIGGAGNLFPTVSGMATGSHIHAVDYIPSFLDNNTVSLISDGSVQITNSSYSNGCNDGYTSIARTVDLQMLETPSLLHVFSAGNSNGSNCGYGAGGQWGNITGGHKQGKNVMTTANVFANAALVSSSSRGPATDGRVKPDITAHGQEQRSTNENNAYQTFGGTSAAAPGIAGVSAQLYDLYGDLNNGDLPPSALIKGALLNTANDAGNVGPDFKFGWGIVNALRAGMLIEDGRYLSDEISQGNTKTHTINVPSGTAQVRFMVYWADKAATPGANPALVNDLDLTVKTPSNETLLPWILDHSPNVSSLDTPAAPGIDRLNNMEQVLINAPAAGNYTVSIEGFNIPQGPQEYFVLYEIIEDNVTITYPNGGEHFRFATKEFIQWDAVDVTGSFNLEYSVDNGSTWENITTVAADKRLYEWTIPDDVATGKALVRVTNGSHVSVSEENFHIAPNPTQVIVDKVCENTITFEWPEIDGADSYDIYVLGEKYMEIVGSSTSTSLTVPIDDYTAEVWFAIAANNLAEGWESSRSTARKYGGGLKNCALGVENNTFENSISLYPNPASNEVHIRMMNTSYSIEKITISNSLGQLVGEMKSDSGSEATLDVSSFKTGIYFVTIDSGQSTTTKKLIIN